MDRGGIEPPTSGPSWGYPACEAGIHTAELPALEPLPMPALFNNEDGFLFRPSETA